MRAILILSFAALEACGATEPEPFGASDDAGSTRDGAAAPEPLSCEDTALDWYDHLIANPAWRACSSDEECVLARNDVRCAAEDGDLHFGGCGLGIATRSSDDFESHRAEREAALCARSDRPRCQVSPIRSTRRQPLSDRGFPRDPRSRPERSRRAAPA